MINYISDDKNIKIESYKILVKDVLSKDLDNNKVKSSLEKTINFSAYFKDELVGCLRVLTDDNFFTIVVEVLVKPIYQKSGIGKTLMDLAYQKASSTLILSAKGDSFKFYEKIGYQKADYTFIKEK